MIESNCGNSSVDMQLIVNLTNISSTEFYAYKCIDVLVTSIITLLFQNSASVQLSFLV